MADLTLKKKVLYGMGGICMIVPDSAFAQWIVVRYIPDSAHALVSPYRFAILFMVARVIGALAEVCIGHFSDHFASKWGRRMPFIRFGLIPFALAFLLMWTPPIGHLHWLNAVYIYLIMQTYLLLYPTVLTPYLALIPELSADPRERVTLTTVQAFAIMMGTILFALLGTAIKGGGWLFAMGLVSMAMLVGLLPFAVTHREKPSVRSTEKVEPLLPAIWSALHNRPFLHLVFSTALFYFSLNIMQMLLPYWVRVYLHADEGQVTLLMAPLLFTTIAIFPAIPWLASRIGKHAMFLGSIAGMIVCMLLFLGIGRFDFISPFAQTALLMALIGAPMAGLSALPFALIADVIDYDEQRTGRRREALFIALQGTIQKSFLAFTAMTFATLAFAGPVGEVTESGLRCVVGVTAAICFAAFAIFLGYPLREHGR